MKAMSTNEQTERPSRKVRQGYVVSDKMDKTVVVRVDRRTTHPLYRKTITQSKRYHAHDETNDVRVGDLVRITETRPLSKTKRWRVMEVVERAK
jgi:small subunit ribosomal protein S17